MEGLAIELTDLTDLDWAERKAALGIQGCFLKVCNIKTESDKNIFTDSVFTSLAFPVTVLSGKCYAILSWEWYNKTSIRRVRQAA